jgi:ankyrin repeat protein
MIAAGLGYVQMTELLLTARADPTMVDTRMGATALHKAAQSGVVDVARLLVQHRAFMDAQAPTLGNTPLIDAVWHKHPAMVRYLLDQGARLEIQNRSGRTARNFADADLALGAPEATET